MANKISINSQHAPQAVGPYCHAVRVGKMVYLSGQIPLIPGTSELAQGIEAQTHQVFKNLQAVIEEAGGSMQDLVRLGIFLTDLGNFTLVNEIMTEYVPEPFPARATVEVSALPKGAEVEIEATIVLSD